MKNVAEAYRRTKTCHLMEETVSELRRSNQSKAEIERQSGVCCSTLRNWETKRTHRPQAVTMDFALRSIGKRLAVVDDV